MSRSVGSTPLKDPGCSLHEHPDRFPGDHMGQSQGKDRSSSSSKRRGRPEIVGWSHDLGMAYFFPFRTSTRWAEPRVWRCCKTWMTIKWCVFECQANQEVGNFWSQHHSFSLVGGIFGPMTSRSSSAARRRGVSDRITWITSDHESAAVSARRDTPAVTTCEPCLLHRWGTPGRLLGLFSIVHLSTESTALRTTLVQIPFESTAIFKDCSKIDSLIVYSNPLT